MIKRKKKNYIQDSMPEAPLSKVRRKKPLPVKGESTPDRDSLEGKSAGGRAGNLPYSE